MQRRPYWKNLLIGIGYMALGNVMSMIMTVALAVLIDNTAVQIVLELFTLFIFYSLVFTAAYRDGVRERLMVKNHRVEGPVKGRWESIGFVMWLVMCIPSVILLLDRFLVLFNGYLIPFRIICGAIYPLSLAIGVDTADVDKMPLFYPFLVMAIYVLIPLATHIGFDFGFKDKFNPDKVMYEKK